MKACEEVVPSELGYGYYCGNAYGGPSELWVSSLKHKSYYMNIAHCFIWSLLCVCLGREDMQLGALQWSWRVSGEAESIFASQKRDEVLDAGGEEDGGEDEVWGTNAIMEDP
jgi:hypothetical protein